MYWFLLRPRWLGGLALCVALAAAFAVLGLWQLDRNTERRQIEAARAAAQDSPPQPAGRLLSTSSPPDRDQEYRSIEAVGRYDADHEYLVRNRTVGRKTGLLVLTPLVTTDGTVLFVVRGWVAPARTGAHAAPEVPAPPDGEVTVAGRLRRPEPGGRIVDLGGQPAVNAIDVAQLGRQLDRPTYRGYVELVSQSPPTGPELSLVPPPDDLGWGPHLAYAVQWFCFSILVFLGYGVAARRHAHPDPSLQRVTARRQPAAGPGGHRGDSPSWRPG